MPGIDRTGRDTFRRPDACGGTGASEGDGGELPGLPSTVVDLTGPEPRVLREGAVPAAEALRRLGGRAE